jgi:hypothetical protein
LVEAVPSEEPVVTRKETTLNRDWDRIREWIAAPPRERQLEPAATLKPAKLPADQVIEARVPERPAFSPPPPPPAHREPAPPPPAPIEVNIGTIIVRANPPVPPRPSVPSPAVSLAAFLARRNAGQP